MINDNGWPDQVDWRDTSPDQALVAAEVLAAVECLRCRDADAALARLQASRISAWRHAVHAIGLLSATLAGHTEDGSERLRLIRDDVLDWSTEPDAERHERHRDVRLTVLTAVDHWAAKDRNALNALVRATPHGPQLWAWEACWLTAGVCSGSGGLEWLERVGNTLRDFTDRQATS